MLYTFKTNKQYTVNTSITYERIVVYRELYFIRAFRG